MPTLINCKACQATLSSQASACANCGQPRGGTTPTRVIMITVVTLLALVLMAGCLQAIGSAGSNG